MVPPITRVSSFRLRRDVAAADTVAHICDNNKALDMFFMLLIGCIVKLLPSASFCELWPYVIRRTHTMYLWQDKRYTADKE